MPENQGSGFFLSAARIYVDGENSSGAKYQMGEALRG